MDSFCFKVQAMILERTHGNALYFVQQVNKSWRSYILENGSKMRPSDIKFDSDQVIIALIRCLRSPNRKFISRELVNWLKLTDYEIIRCMKLLLNQVVREVAIEMKKFVNLVSSVVFNRSINAQNALEFVSIQLPLSGKMRRIDSQARKIIGVGVDQGERKEIDSIEKLNIRCLLLLFRVTSRPPAVNDIINNLAVNAMNTIDNNTPLKEMNSFEEVLKNFNDGESFSSTMEELCRLYKTALSFARAIIVTLDKGILQFTRDLKRANLYDDII